MSYDLNAIINQAAVESVDLTEASTGGGGAYEPPAAGIAVAVLVGYLELGRRLKKGYKGAKDSKPRQAKWIFELHGKDRVTVDEEGRKHIKRITVKTWLPEPGKQPNDKSGFYKLFAALNYDKDPAVKIPAQLLGRHFKVKVVHTELDGQDGKFIYANIGGAQEGFNITAPRIDLTDDDGMPTGEFRQIPCPERITDIKCFLWDYANKAMWDELFIEGEFPAVEAKDGKPAREARTKNVIQQEIRTALDWEGSVIQTILASAGVELNVEEIADSASVAAAAAVDDPLAGML